MPDHRFLRIEPSYLSSRRLDRIKNADSAAAGGDKDADADQHWNWKTDMPLTLWNQGALVLRQTMAMRTRTPSVQRG